MSDDTTSDTRASRLLPAMTEHVLIGAGESIVADLNRLADVGVRFV